TPASPSSSSVTRGPAYRRVTWRRFSISTSPRPARRRGGMASGFPSAAGWPVCWEESSPRSPIPGAAGSSGCASRSLPPANPESAHEAFFTRGAVEVHDGCAKVGDMKILVVEDDRKVAGFIEQGLKEEGHVVDVAPDGDEATMLAHVYEYDVILLDVVLPKKNGFQVAAELRREGRTTPILMLTSRDATEDVVRGLDAGADDYLAKPFRFDELLARMRALGRRGGAARVEVPKAAP